jgi:hypothetical protein
MLKNTMFRGLRASASRATGPQSEAQDKQLGIAVGSKIKLALDRWGRTQTPLGVFALHLKNVARAVKKNTFLYIADIGTCHDISLWV